ncbi:MAG TPA: PIN domain-containing protein [Chthoniobacterales bacterium]
MGSLIDTSVWIDAFHSKSPPSVKAMASAVINRIDAVVCEPVHLEFFRGIPDRELPRAQQYFDTFPMLSTPPSLWREATDLLRKCLRSGSPVNPLDALISIIAITHDATIVTFDHDFLILKQHSKLSVELLARVS